MPKKERFPFEVVQEEPNLDPLRPVPHVWVDHLTPLMELPPGVWHRMRRQANLKAAKAVANSLKRKETKIPDGRWEFCGTIQPDGNAYVFAKYLGPGQHEEGAKSRRKARKAAPTFRSWLVNQKERKDAVGELARFAIKDTSWPAHGPMGKARFETYLAGKGSPMTNWFAPAWAEFEKNGSEAPPTDA